MVLYSKNIIQECPDCGKPMKKFFVVQEKPWCEDCDVYWERIGDMWCKTLNARELYDEYVKTLSIYHAQKEVAI